MKYIVAVLAGLLTVALTQTVSANPSNVGDSVLMTQPTANKAAAKPQYLVSTPSVAVSAPLMDASQAQTKIDSPIVAEPAPAPVPESAQYVQPRRSHHRPKKKQSFFDKVMEMERKKNAWLKRTFLGQ